MLTAFVSFWLSEVCFTFLFLFFSYFCAMSFIRFFTRSPVNKVKQEFWHHINIGMSSKRRYQYFVPRAHPGAIRIVSKDKKV